MPPSTVWASSRRMGFLSLITAKEALDGVRDYRALRRNA